MSPPDKPAGEQETLTAKVGGAFNAVAGFANSASASVVGGVQSGATAVGNAAAAVPGQVGKIPGQMQAAGAALNSAGGAAVDQVASYISSATTKDPADEAKAADKDASK